ncbi:MAG: helix-turn-helix domain-containing protein, partial [Spirochaetes bacterium]|nr:helix-turn-helix domain-containing protein [Spirochaetota bacterium]
KNIESYYQQIGRAGRDGLPAETILFYSFGDIITLRNIIEENGNQEVQLHKLERMKQFAEAVNCRRKILLNYFGENPEHDCGNCDVCRNPPVFFDGTIIAQKALSALARINRGIGQNTLIDVLRGSSRHEILKNGYHNIKTHGAGKDISYAEWQHYIVQLINFGLIEIAYEKSNTLRLTEHSKDVLFNNKTIQLIHPAVTREIMDQRAQSSKPKTKKQQLDENLFEELKVLRKKLADQSEVPAYVVFSDTTLTEMASSKPIKKVELLDITGVGQKKLDLYGDIFIDKIIAFIQNASKNGSQIKGGTYLITHDHYKQGLTAKEIAGKRGLNISTIYSHLAQLYENGENIDIQNMIDKSELQTVLQAIKQIGIPEKLKTMYDYLNQSVEYDKIRLAIAYHNREKSRQIQMV